MNFLKNEILNRCFLSVIGAADFTAKNCRCNQIVLNKQVFVAFGLEKEINITYW